jgi:hypothetical protein
MSTNYVTLDLYVGNLDPILWSSRIKSTYVISSKHVLPILHTPYRSNIRWQYCLVILAAVFLNGQKNDSEWKMKKRLIQHHMDPILCNDFSCRSKSMENPILAVTDLPHFASSCNMVLAQMCHGYDVTNCIESCCLLIELTLSLIRWL